MEAIVTLMEFEKAPGSVGMLWKAAWARKKGRFVKEGLQRFEARMQCSAGEGVAEYRAICGFEEASSIPITFPHILAAPLHLAIATHSKFPLPAMGLIHASNRIVQHRPLGAEETLDIRCWIEGHRVVAIGIEADLMTEIKVGEEIVWESCSTVLSRAVEGDGVKRPRPKPPEIEDQLTLDWSLPANLGRSYGGISKDYNPIHLYPWTAKLFGFRRQIAHGMCLLGMSAAALPPVKEGSAVLEVHFRKPVFLPTPVKLASGAHQEGQAFRLLAAKDGKVHFHGWLGPLTEHGND